MQKDLKTVITNGILFLLLFFIFYFYANYMYIGGFGIGYQYIACAAVVMIGGLSFLVAPKLSSFFECIRDIVILSIPYLVCMVFTLGIWIFTFTGIRQMISGFFAPMYIILSISCVGCLVYMIGEKAVVYTFWAMSAAFGVMIVEQIRLVGLGEFFYELYMLLASGSLDALPAMMTLEGPRFSYCYGLYFLYFFFRRETTAKGIFRLRMFVCILCFLIGFKRSCVLATAVGAVIVFFYMTWHKNRKREFINLLIVCFIAFSFLYIPTVRYGLFERIVEKYHINTSHRERLYNIYTYYYEYNPSYMGRGLGWVQNHLRGQEGIYAYDVHNEYLRNYIELGFWGYIFWTITILPWVLKCSVTYKNPREDGLVAGSMVYMAVLYITENIFLFYTFSITLSVVIMVSRQYGKEKDKIDIK